eukprot:4955711-Pyramimonas_sp.AAC.1
MLLGWVRSSAVSGLWAPLPSATWSSSGARCRRLDAPLKGANSDDTNLRAIRVASALAASVF